MAVGIGMIGRDITMTVGGASLLGVVEKSLSRSNELLETTDDNSSGWQEYLAESGKKAVSLTVSGLTKNLELVQTWYGTSQIMACVVTYPDGSTESFDGTIESLETTGPSNELSTYSLSLQSSGVSTFVAGT